MANSIVSGLQRDAIAEAALTAFTKTIAPLGLFSTAFNDVPLQGTDVIQVPYYPLVSAASKDYNGTYEFDSGTTTQTKSITIDKRKYQPMSFTSAELRRQPNFDPKKLGEMKGMKLAEDVITDIFSLITASAFGDTALSGDNFDAASKLVSTAANFDADDVIDLETICNAQNWPVVGRGLIIKPSYMGNVKKDLVANGGLATYGFNPDGSRASFPMLSSFNVAESNIIPANGENLVGFAVYPSALLVGFSPIRPDDSLLKLVDYQPYTDPETGITIEFRAWADADTDTVKQAWEVNYGRAIGETVAIKRIVSA